MIRSKTLMENLISKKDFAAVAGGGGRRRSVMPNDQAACCRKHPKHRQSPGVCSLCLKEKLSRLSTSSSSRCTTIASSSSSSLSSYCSSCSASSSYASSPMHHRHRFPKEGKDGFFLLMINGKDVLSKSRSVVFGSRLTREEGKNKTGFLSKLLHPRRVH